MDEQNVGVFESVLLKCFVWIIVEVWIIGVLVLYSGLYFCCDGCNVWLL